MFLIRHSMLLTVLGMLTAIPTHLQAQATPGVSSTAPLRSGLLGYWPLTTDAKDHSGQQRDADPVGAVQFGVVNDHSFLQQAADFDGQKSYLQISNKIAPQPGASDFSISLWMRTKDSLADVPGDLISQYDPNQRTGYCLGLKTQSVTTSPANDRHLQFGIDQNLESTWVDCGRPGQALLAFALVAHDGKLFAGTCEPESGQAGHVYCYAGDQNWLDCGSPDQSNAVTALAVFEGELYAATGKYRVAGSSLPESDNSTRGGRVFRYAGEQNWIDCGQLPNTEMTGAMIVYKGELYASSLYHPAGLYRYDGKKQWISCGSPDGKRVVALSVYNGYIYAGSYDGGKVYRFDGQGWEDCGQVGQNTQTYDFCIYQGDLFVATWPSGKVYRMEQVNQWIDAGQLGSEQEVMGMAVHNGRFLGGTLPSGQVYSWEANGSWRLLATLDQTPDVRYRRAWTMAEYDGHIYCSVLPSGKIYAYQAGQNLFTDKSLSAGWHHILATRTGGQLSLYVDGQLQRQQGKADQPARNLNNPAPLLIGFGSQDSFCGQLAEVAIYNRLLSEQEIKLLQTHSSDSLLKNSPTQ